MVSLRSERTPWDYAEALVQFVGFVGRSPEELARLSYDEVYGLMRKFALWRFREVGVSAKRVKNQWFALASFFRFNGVKGDFSFPSRSIPLTLKYLDKIPTRDELRLILSVPRLDLSTRIAIHFIAFAGLRLEDVCNLTYGCIREDFEKGKTPMAVWVPQGKTGKTYVTFVPGETVELLRQHFKHRKERGERITVSSPIIIDLKQLVRGRIKRIARKSLTMRITRALKKSGVVLEEKLANGIVRRMRPYSLRKYFRSNLTGHMPSEYIEALMGHTSGLEHVYGGTRDLDPATIERMREAYKRCVPYLLPSYASFDQQSLIHEAKIEALKSIAKNLLGIDLLEVKIAREKELGRKLSKEEEIKLFETELRKLREGKHNPRRIISEGELEKYILEGWDVQTVLPSGKILIRKSV